MVMKILYMVGKVKKDNKFFIGILITFFKD
jgi:hypothetical protein